MLLACARMCISTSCTLALMLVNILPEHNRCLNTIQFYKCNVLRQLETTCLKTWHSLLHHIHLPWSMNGCNRNLQEELYCNDNPMQQAPYQSLSQVRNVETKVPLPTSSAELVGLCFSTHSWPPSCPPEPLPEARRPPVAPLLGPGRPLLLAPPVVLAPAEDNVICHVMHAHDLSKVESTSSYELCLHIVYLTLDSWHAYMQ